MQHWWSLQASRWVPSDSGWKVRTLIQGLADVSACDRTTCLGLGQRETLFPHLTKAGLSSWGVVPGSRLRRSGLSHPRPAARQGAGNGGKQHRLAW